MQVSIFQTVLSWYAWVLFLSFGWGSWDACGHPVSSNAVVISVISQPMSNQVISDELSKWDLEGWDWQINQVSEREFAVTFPTKERLKMMASCSRFTLPLNQVMVFVKATVDGAKVVASLSQTWVLLDDVPSGLHNARFLMAFGGLVGKPVPVDDASLEPRGSIRMKIRCLDLSRVHGYIDVFPATDAYRIRPCTEGMVAHQVPPPPPPPAKASKP